MKQTLLSRQRGDVHVGRASWVKAKVVSAHGTVDRRARKRAGAHTQREEMPGAGPLGAPSEAGPEWQQLGAPNAAGCAC